MPNAVTTPFADLVKRCEESGLYVELAQSAVYEGAICLVIYRESDKASVYGVCMESITELDDSVDMTMRALSRRGVR